MQPPDTLASPYAESTARIDADEIANRLLFWWRRLVGPEASGTLRGDRAQLRRASTLAEAELCIACLRTAQHIAPDVASWPRERQRGLAACIALLASVEPSVTDEPASIAARAGAPRARGDETPLVSPLRMRRLIECDRLEDLFVQLRRLLPLMKHHVDPASLIRDIFEFRAHEGRERVRRRWAYDYPWPNLD